MVKKTHKKYTKAIHFTTAKNKCNNLAPKLYGCSHVDIYPRNST